ncbi:hypothetical protein GQ457_16G016940 [Hibiscus cannabinus]
MADKEGSGSRKRFRMGKGKAVLPPTEDDLNGFLKFTTKARKTRYADIKTRRVNPGKYVHTQSLEELQIREAFESMIVSMWWKNFVTINCPTFIELTREFYTTFKFDIPENFTFDTKDIVKFRLMGKEFSQSITEFNLALGLIDTTFVTTDSYKSSTVDFVDAFCSSRVWNDMSSDNSHYNPSSSKGATLRRPEWVYMQRFLAFSFSGRKDTADICTKTELYFIWSMLHDNPINLGFWLASQFHSILTNGKSLCLGFVITHLAINLNLITLDDPNLHVACEMEPLNIDSLLKMKVLAKVGGVYTFAQIRHPLPSNLFAGLFEKTTPPLHNDANETGSSDPWARIERRLSRMEKNLEALMHHCGLLPDEVPLFPIFPSELFHAAQPAKRKAPQDQAAPQPPLKKKKVTSTSTATPPVRPPAPEEREEPATPHADTAASVPKPPAKTATASKKTLTRKDKGKAPVRASPRAPAPEATVELDSDDEHDDDMLDVPPPPAPPMEPNLPRRRLKRKANRNASTADLAAEENILSEAEDDGSSTTPEETLNPNPPSSKARYKRMATKQTPKIEKEEMLQHSRKDDERKDTAALVH